MSHKLKVTVPICNLELLKATCAARGLPEPTHVKDHLVAVLGSDKLATGWLVKIRKWESCVFDLDAKEAHSDVDNDATYFDEFVGEYFNQFTVKGQKIWEEEMMAAGGVVTVETDDDDQLVLLCSQ